MKDLIDAFSDPAILNSSVLVKVIDSDGQVEPGERTGVFRDVLTEFWMLFMQSLAIGATSKVLVTRHDFQKKDWKAIGRVLRYGYCREGKFPLALSPAFICSCIYDEDSISDI